MFKSIVAHDFRNKNPEKSKSKVSVLQRVRVFKNYLVSTLKNKFYWYPFNDEIDSKLLWENKIIYQPSQ